MAVGRRPKPAAIRELQGNVGKRPINKNEPQFSGKAEMPDLIARTPEAAKEWNRVMRELAALDLVKSTDQAMLSAYCMQWARYLQAEEEISRDGQTTRVLRTDKKGEIVKIDGVPVVEIRKHPAVTVSEGAVKLLKNFAEQFGFSPSARSRINLNPNEEKADPFETFLNGGVRDNENDSRKVH
jgi:P27 family predicted phage terminase small subunit